MQVLPQSVEAATHESPYSADNCVVRYFPKSVLENVIIRSVERIKCKDAVLHKVPIVYSNAKCGYARSNEAPPQHPDGEVTPDLLKAEQNATYWRTERRSKAQADPMDIKSLLSPSFLKVDM